MTVSFIYHDHANPRFLVNVEDAPDTTNSSTPGTPTVRPVRAEVLFGPNGNGALCASWVHVGGPKVRSDGSVTVRDYSITFTDPLGPHSTAPDWVRDLARHFSDLLNPAEPAAGAGASAADRIRLGDECLAAADEILRPNDERHCDADRMIARANAHYTAAAALSALGGGVPAAAGGGRPADGCAADEEHRRSLAVILGLPPGADWLVVTRRIIEIRSGVKS